MIASDDSGTDWLVASAGLQTPVVAVTLRNGTNIDPSDAGPEYVCDHTMPCAGTDRFGMRSRGRHMVWRSGLCAHGGYSAPCTRWQWSALDPRAHHRMRSCRQQGSRLRASVSRLALPTRRRVLGDPPMGEIVFVGAPAGPGHVFAAQPSGVGDVTPAGLPATGGIGGSLAVGRIQTGGTPDLLVVAGGPSRWHGALRGDPRAGRPMQMIGCISRKNQDSAARWPWETSTGTGATT